MVGLDIVGHVSPTWRRRPRRAQRPRTTQLLQTNARAKVAGRQNQRVGSTKRPRAATVTKTHARRSTGKRSSTIPRANQGFPRWTWPRTLKTQARASRCCLASTAAAATKPDKAGLFLWSALSELWTYAANRIPKSPTRSFAIDPRHADGFNWELGPFELWDAAGVQASVARMQAEGPARRR